MTSETDEGLARLAAALRRIAPQFDQADRAAFAIRLADALESASDDGSAVVQPPFSGGPTLQ